MSPKHIQNSRARAGLNRTLGLKEYTIKTFSFRHVLLIAGVIIGLGFFTMPAFAQDAVKMQELQRVIDAQQKQMEAQQKQLDAQRQLLQDLQKQMESLVKDADTAELPVAAEKPAAKPEVASTKPPPPVEGRYLGGGGERAKLSLSRWVNRMVNIVDDGKDEGTDQQCVPCSGYARQPDARTGILRSQR